MSLLNQLFNRGVFGAKCKTCITLSISRIKLLQNKRDLQLKHMRNEIAQFLQAGQEAIARIRVEHVIREQNIWAAYEILELFCEFVLARIPILENQKDCPAELREAVSSIIFATPRCSEVPDLLQIKNLFNAKYGKEFVMAATELRPDSGVNRTIIEKLSVSAPSAEERLKVLKEIAQEFNLEWDSSATEVELKKQHADLLGGSKQIIAEATTSCATTEQSSPKFSTSNGPSAVTRTNSTRAQGSHYYHSSGPSSNMHLINSSGIESSNRNHNRGPAADANRESTSRSSDVLERARAAIAAADRATAAAHAAAELVNVQFGSLTLEGKST